MDPLRQAGDEKLSTESCFTSRRFTGTRSSCLSRLRGEVVWRQYLWSGRFASHWREGLDYPRYLYQADCSNNTPRTNSLGDRPNSGVSRTNNGGSRINSAVSMTNSGGARTNIGGSMHNSGGYRPNSGEARKVPGRPFNNPVELKDPNLPVKVESDSHVTTASVIILSSTKVTTVMI